VPYLEPYPDRLLDDLPGDGSDPAAVAEQRESVALAFVVALQRLTARQRAVLILREVLGWSAAVVAELLGTSVPAVNSARQRARAGLDRAVPPAGVSARSLPATEQEVLRRFMAAWRRADTGGLAAYLPATDGSHRAYGVMVLVVAGDAVQAIAGFQDASLLQAFGLPQTL
jgi:RNA polymerase sigma-70 factor (ECF subfamily)